jgi:hypothetical protein
MGKFRADSRVGIDLGDLAGKLPSATSTDSAGRASWLKDININKNETDGDQHVPSASSNETVSANISSSPSAEQSTPKAGLSTSGSPSSIARLVVGASNDFIVDREGITETATYLDVAPIFVEGLYHDVMLGTRWNETANIIADWLNITYAMQPTPIPTQQAVI